MEQKEERIMSERTNGKVFHDLWNPPPMEERTQLSHNLTPEEIEEAIQSIDWKEVNRKLEERLTPYIGNSVVWCWTPWGGFWRRR